jgi:hypothetical protein
MATELDDLGFDKTALDELVKMNPGKVKLRLGDGRIVELLQGHLNGGTPLGGGGNPFGAVTKDDHDKSTKEGHDKVQSTHDKGTTKFGIDAKTGDLVHEQNGLFIGDMSEVDALKLKTIAADMLKDRDFMIVKKLTK